MNKPTAKSLCPAMPRRPRVLEVDGQRCPLTELEITLLRRGLEHVMKIESNNREGSIASALLHFLLKGETVEAPERTTWRRQHDYQEKDPPNE